MKTKIISVVLMITFLSHITLISQQVKQKNQFFIVFYTYNKNLSEDILTGHIFVGFERLVANDRYQDGKYGFIPKNGISKEDFLKGEAVEGILISEESTPVNESYKVKLSEKDYQKALKTASEWSNASMQYIGLSNDCISFASDIAHSAKLKVPERGPLQLPQDYLDELRLNNILRVINN